jgi:hypothetical protein
MGEDDEEGRHVSLKSARMGAGGYDEKSIYPTRRNFTPRL